MTPDFAAALDAKLEEYRAWAASRPVREVSETVSAPNLVTTASREWHSPAENSSPRSR